MMSLSQCHYPIPLYYPQNLRTNMYTYTSKNIFIMEWVQYLWSSVDSRSFTCANYLTIPNLLVVIKNHNQELPIAFGQCP